MSDWPNYIVQNWDTNQSGATWDSGLSWDVNVGPALGNTDPYLSRITSEHNQRPKFMTMIQNVVQPLADNIAVMESMTSLFDVDVAVGDQENTVGQWVGVIRDIAVPLTGVYFSFDDPALGFDSGTWFSNFNPVTGVVHLDDESYRTLIRARITNNQWDGTIPGAYAVWDTVFAETGVSLLIQDLENMHMILALTGPVPNAVTLALFKGGYLNIKPAGVKIDAYLTPTVSNTPYFGFDVENQSISGFDVGAWGNAS
jgi:hypothetical protein